MKANKLDMELVKEMYVIKERSSYQIADELGCNWSTIIRRLKKNNVKIKPSGFQKGCKYFRKTNFDKNLIKEMYLKGISSFKIAKEIKCSESYILKTLKEMGIKRRGNKKYFDIELIKDMYLNQKLSATKISKKLGCCCTTITRILDKYGFKIKQKKKKLLIDINTIKKMYLEEKLSSEKIAKKLGCYTDYILQTLRKNNIKIRPLKRLKLPKEEIIKDYESCSIRELEKKYNCSDNSINRLFKKNGIKIKNNSEIKRILFRLNKIEKSITREEVRRKAIQSLCKKPNKLESSIIKIIQKLNLPYTYNGSKADLIVGGKIPDFYNNNSEKKIIEVFGDYWHNPFKKIGLEWKRTEQGTMEHYAKYHYSCCILWENEINKNQEEVERKLIEFDKL